MSCLVSEIQSDILPAQKAYAIATQLKLRVRHFGLRIKKIISLVLSIYFG